MDASVSDVTKSLGDVVISAAEDHDDELTSPSAVLETFTNAVLGTRDEIMRESFLESCIDVLKPRGDALDSGRLAVLKDSALTCIPPFLSLVSGATAPKAKEVLNLIAEYADAREVTLALNLQLGEMCEHADPFAVSDGEDDVEEDTEIDWNNTFPQLEEVLSMYTTAFSKLKTQKSTPTLLSLQGVLLPLLKAIPASAPPEMAVTMSRSLVLSVAHLVDAAAAWSKTTTDVNGEQNAILTELIQTTVMIFGPNVFADLTQRWFLAVFPRYAGLHEERDWECGQASLDAALSTVHSLGITQADFLDKITNSSRVRPHQSIASLILLAASLPPPGNGEFSPTKDTLADAMPVLNLAINGSAIDAGTVVVWALVHAAKTGQVLVEYDQVTFLMEHIMPLIQMDASATARLALSKLLGAMIAAVSPPRDQLRLYEQLLEPLNPFEGVRVLGLSLLREQLSVQPSLLPGLAEMLEPILWRLPPVDSPLDMSLAKLIASFWPVWLTESANMIWFLLELDVENQSGIRDRPRRTALKNLWLNPIQKTLAVWNSEGTSNAEVLGVLERLGDAIKRASDAVAAS